MDIKAIKSNKYTATITIGLQVGYTDQLLSKAMVIAQLQKFQDELISTEGAYLSAAVSECDIFILNHVSNIIKHTMITLIEKANSDIYSD